MRRLFVAAGIVLLFTGCSYEQAHEKLGIEESGSENDLHDEPSAKFSYSNSTQTLLSSSDLNLLNKCSIDGLEYFINSSTAKHYNMLFDEQFQHIKAQPTFDSFWTAERRCQLSDGKKLITFSYLSKGDKDLTQISRGMHTLFVLFDEQDKSLAESDIACPFADDVGGISEMQIYGNYLYTECGTQGSYGAMSGHSYGSSEVHRINLTSFGSELVWQGEWDRDNGNLQILSDEYFVTKDQVPPAIQERISKLSKR